MPFHFTFPAWPCELGMGRVRLRLWAHASAGRGFSRSPHVSIFKSDLLSHEPFFFHMDFRISSLVLFKKQENLLGSSLELGGCAHREDRNRCSVEPSHVRALLLPLRTSCLFCLPVKLREFSIQVTRVPRPRGPDARLGLYRFTCVPKVKLATLICAMRGILASGLLYSIPGRGTVRSPAQMTRTISPRGAVHFCLPVLGAYEFTAVLFSCEWNFSICFFALDLI